MVNEEEIHSCCNRISKFMISYKFGNTYKVCPTCFKLPHWNEGIISREVTDYAKTV